MFYISNLIAELEALRDSHGDLPVMHWALDGYHLYRSAPSNLYGINKDLKTGEVVAVHSWQATPETQQALVFGERPEV